MSDRSHDALTQPERSALYAEQTERDVKRSIQDGFAWLDHHYSVEKNPGPSAPPFHYYYLYGLERAAMVRNEDPDLAGSAFAIPHYDYDDE